MSSAKVTLAAACMRIVHDKRLNLETYRQFIEEAGEKEANLIAFPECSLQGYTWTWDQKHYRYVHDDSQLAYFQENSEPVPGPATELLWKEAKKYNMYIQFGMAEKSGDKMYNSAILLGPEGLKGVYRKVHMAPNPVFTPGDTFSVFDTDIGRIGPIICLDLTYPESTRCLAIKGADIVINSTAWGMNGSDPQTDWKGYKYETLTTSTAIMNQVWMIHSDQIGHTTRSNEYCYGHSRILDPMGKIVADSGYNEGLAIATVDLKGELARARGQEFMGRDLLMGRRPELYGVLTAKTEVSPLVR